MIHTELFEIIHNAVLLARKTGKITRFSFRDIEMNVFPDDKGDWVFARFEQMYYQEKHHHFSAQERLRGQNPQQRVPQQALVGEDEQF